MTPTSDPPVVGNPRDEWRGTWPLPFVAMLGIAGSSIFSYSSGVFLVPMTREFGWTRATFSSAFTVQMLLLIFVAPLAGRVIDRFGPRRVALIGMVPFAIALSCLGLANGSPRQWVMLCVISGISVCTVSPVVWLTAVVGRFQASRGLALGIAQAGLGVATAVWPATAAYFITRLGWRQAFAAMALVWLVPMVPLAILFFRGPRDLGGRSVARTLTPPPAARPAIARLMLSRTFVCLTLAGALFSGVSLGTMLHMVPLLQSGGLPLATAATIASVAGIATLIGRLTTGLLLDRFPAKTVAITTFLVPIIPVLMLWHFKGSLDVSVAAVIVFGFTAGAESDVVAYIASRLLPSSVFASCYAIIIAAFAIFASMGPLVASRLFDAYGSYDPFLLLIVPVVLVGAALLTMLPRLPVPQRAAAAAA